MPPKLKLFTAQEDIPTLAAVSPEYSALLERREELTAEMQTLRGEQTTLFSKLDKSSKSRPVVDQDARVAAILGDAAVERPGPTDQERYTSNLQRQADVKEALHVLTGRIMKARMAASAIICEQVEERHKKLVRNVAEKLLEVREAAAEYFEFAQTLNSDGVAWSRLHAMHPHFLGEPNDRQGDVARYLREAAKHGFISPALIPERFK